jgi:hypothetical protein
VDGYPQAPASEGRKTSVEMMALSPAQRKPTGSTC